MAKADKKRSTTPQTIGDALNLSNEDWFWLTATEWSAFNHPMMQPTKEQLDEMDRQPCNPVVHFTPEQVAWLEKYYTRFPHMHLRESERASRLLCESLRADSRAVAEDVAKILRAQQRQQQAEPAPDSGGWLKDARDAATAAGEISARSKISFVKDRLHERMKQAVRAGAVAKLLKPRTIENKLRELKLWPPE